MNRIIELVFFGNSVGEYLIAVALFLCGVLIITLARSFMLRRLKAWAQKTETIIDDFLIETAQKYLFPLIYFVAFNLSIKSLSLSPGIINGVHHLFIVALTITGVLFLTSFVRFVLLKLYIKRTDNQSDVGNRISAIMPALTVLIWTIGLVFVLDNLGFEVSAIMAGLGIGGVAVALAASVILNDLFSYFAIMFDQPFVIGDFIVVGEFMGTVEKIGIKTTRIRSLGGELLVFSNKDLTDSRIRNFKRMDRRRIVFQVGVTYGTMTKKLRSIPAMIKGIIDAMPGASYDRAHFAKFADSCLTIEVVYFVESADFNRYMDIQQEINFSIKEAFENDGVEFAFPTQTLHLIK